MVHGSSQDWESKMGLCFCSETLTWLTLNSGMEQTAPDRNVSGSEGLRTGYHFPHYPILCQVTGETFGGKGCQGGCEFSAGV